MPLTPNQVVQLVDARQRLLGEVTIQGTEGDLVRGRFAPGPDYPVVRDLFREFEEAANQQLFGLLDGLEAPILGLGLHLRPLNGALLPEVHDVQIMNGTDFSCRLRGAARDPQGRDAAEAR
jgi:hypothetical protein